MRVCRGLGFVPAEPQPTVLRIVKHGVIEKSVSSEEYKISRRRVILVLFYYEFQLHAVGQVEPRDYRFIPAIRIYDIHDYGRD